MITIEQIKAAQDTLAEIISQFEAQAKQPRIITIIPEAEIGLAKGEHYAGIITDKDGQPDYHLILLPSKAEGINWKDAIDWAKKSGGELPTRREQALLYANLKEQFEERWCWSCEAHASDSGYAWDQYFGSGDQLYNDVFLKLCARAVRRVEIKEQGK